jgi:hypothetical protein
MLACFREKLPASMIAARIEAATGEKVAERTIGRRKAEWEAEQKRRRMSREWMSDLMAAAREGDSTSWEMVQALASEQLQRDGEGILLAVDPIRLQQTSIAAQKVRLQGRVIDLKERQVRLDEAKFEILKAEREKAIKTAEELETKVASGRQLTEDDIRRIREVYGISN